ncbi:RNA polymerase sigma factor [Ruminococcus flavefaciens]|jgi:RNA polymerase sigma-70 factor (ECF subfamily)|uniref:RNA polymerase sigma factor n=1 Tax=Ruminococcus flavefaciens TaxID=1265 RepID=UPI00048DF9F5|nr:sigma-70 family RNA polymerase sigma factor [Ruminococcus flavefaciens]
MEDQEIIELYFRRSEDAIAETRSKYGAYCNTIVYGILHDSEDSEECLNDTYLRLWDTIPPEKPENLKAYIARLVRNSALNMYKKRNAARRGGDFVKVALDELRDCVPDSTSGITEKLELRDLAERFLRELTETERVIFLRRYWYMCPISEIAETCGIKEYKVASILKKTRKLLKRYLEKEGAGI